MPQTQLRGGHRHAYTVAISMVCVCLADSVNLISEPKMSPDDSPRQETKKATPRYNVTRGIIRILNASLMLMHTLITTNHAFITFTNLPTITNNTMVESSLTDESTFYTLRCTE